MNHMQLRAIGIPDTNIITNTDCTSCETTTYFSHRKEKGQTGRLASYMMIK
ncbi:MAG: laccase domain-containing protein [Bacilli bacterium]